MPVQEWVGMEVITTLVNKNISGEYPRNDRSARFYDMITNVNAEAHFPAA